MASSRARYVANLANTLDSSGHVTSSNVLLPASGVTAGTYGSALLVPVLTIDTYGRVTSAATANVTLSSFNTGNLTEGSNLYYTDARARAAHGYVTGTAAYNSTTGVFTIPSTSSHITEGTNLFYTDTRARAALSGSTGVTYNSTTEIGRAHV